MEKDDKSRASTQADYEKALQEFPLIEQAMMVGTEISHMLPKNVAFCGVIFTEDGHHSVFSSSHIDREGCAGVFSKVAEEFSIPDNPSIHEFRFDLDKEGN